MADKFEMALDELADAVVWKRAAVLSPSQAEYVLMLIRRAQRAETEALRK